MRDASWFGVRTLAPGVWVLQDPIGQVVPEYDVHVVNLYLVEGQDRAVLVDSGMGLGDVFAVCRALTDKPLHTICTHSHWDHVGGAHQFAERLISPVEADRLNASYEVEGVGTIRAAPATGTLAEGDVVDLGDRTLTVWQTPGHSPGHISLVDSASGLLFCADTCYAGTLWFQTDDANLDDWRGSLERLAASGARALCGGHEEPIQAPALARSVRDGLEAALAGRSTMVPFPLDPDACKHSFGEFSILLRADATTDAMA